MREPAGLTRQGVAEVVLLWFLVIPAGYLLIVAW